MRDGCAHCGKLPGMSACDWIECAASCGIRTYIAGPMTGLPELNFPAFHAKAAEWRARGHTVLNPAEINPDPGMAWSDAMRADIAMLVTCHQIVLLDGWTRSKGATLEHHIAVALGLHVVHPE